MTPLTQIDRKVLLIVDDDSHVVHFLQALLTRKGYGVITAESGDDAIKKSRECKGEIALLLSDFQMPGMSGIDLATRLTTERPQLKVLLMSGFPNGMLILNEGWHFLAKPFINSQLCNLISGLIFPHETSRFAASGGSA